MFINVAETPEFVRQVQRKLRDIEYWTKGTATVGVDGDYDEGTRAAVTDFQRQYGLEPTGTVDYATWVTINSIHKLYSSFYARATPLRVFPDRPNYEVGVGERSSLVFALQLLMQELAQIYDCFENVKPTGFFTEQDAEAVKQYQLIHGLPAGGRIDKPTWNRLAGDYNTYYGNN